MKNRGLYFLLAMLVGSLISCSDKSSNLGNQQVKALLYQVGGCQSHVADEVSQIDSCFTYQFIEKLDVDFCMPANCCPDSNRFAFSYSVKNDTIFMVVTDTAERNCYCFCSYTIHAEFENLPLTRYVFYCTRPDDGDKVYYNQVVYRSNPQDK
jgi:hypothetical protein